MSDKVIKVAVGIPVHGDPKAKFVQSLTAMIAYTLQSNLKDEKGDDIRVEMETFIVSSSMLTEGRHRIFFEALAWGADYLMFLDSDHVFPHDAFCRLWAHNLPVVGCNYARRDAPTGPTAAYWDDERGAEMNLYTTEEKAQAGLVEPCAHLGFGVCLIHMGIINKLHDHAQEAGEKTVMPLFKFTETPGMPRPVGEDVYFFRKLRDAGIEPYVDHGLSWEVGHLFEVILTNAHTVAQRDKFEERRLTRGDKFELRAQKLEQEAEGALVDAGPADRPS